ncbi:MAG: hypothetical protein DRN14_04090 [Thermoplasmata archaeon]|nr:MAG: hypothetical protein DRN14_04090 [Thermoplasmata archaeon]
MHFNWATYEICYSTFWEEIRIEVFDKNWKRKNYLSIPLNKEVVKAFLWVFLWEFSKEELMKLLEEVIRDEYKGMG